MKSKLIALLSPLILCALAFLMVIPAHSYLPGGNGAAGAFTNSTWTTSPAWVINPNVTGVDRCSQQYRGSNVCRNLDCNHSADH
jgi:hypothetical protein